MAGTATENVARWTLAGELLGTDFLAYVLNVTGEELVQVLAGQRVLDDVRSSVIGELLTFVETLPRSDDDDWSWRLHLDALGVVQPSHGRLLRCHDITISHPLRRLVEAF